MKTFKKLLFILPLGFALSCAPEFEDEVTFNPGNANFANFVAIGNSLTSGFQSSALARTGQENSFPAILASQFAEIGGGAFKQPLMAPGPGVGSAGNPEFILGYFPNCKGEIDLSPIPSALSGQTSAFADDLGAQGPFNNVGVPGAKSFHLGFPGYENLNPFYKRFAVAGEPMINAAVRAQPTFFSLWIGANDVLSYALAAGEGVDQKGNIDPTTYGSADITDPGVFAQTMNSLVGALTANGAKGVIANIPYVTSLPYFNAISRDALELSAAQAAALNAGYANYNGALDALAATGGLSASQAARRKISFVEGPNRFVIWDDDLRSVSFMGSALPNARHISYNEYLILTTPGDSLTCFGMGSQNPIPDRYVLTAAEVRNINEATVAFNSTIQGLANANGLAYVDANKLLSEMESGLTYNGVTYTTAMVTGGLFSLDGFHPNKQGYAVIANEFIKSINSKFGAKVRQVDPSQYEGVIFP